MTFSYSTEDKSLVDGRESAPPLKVGRSLICYCYQHGYRPIHVYVHTYSGLFVSRTDVMDSSTGWFPIRDAWSTWNIPHPDHLAQKTQRVITPESSKEDNALMAANCARNLLLGWKPDQMTDLKKLRNNIWNEVSFEELDYSEVRFMTADLLLQTKRLYERKAKGKLVVDSRDY